RLDALAAFFRRVLIEPLQRLASRLGEARRHAHGALPPRRRLVLVVIVAAAAYGLYRHPPFAPVRQSEVIVRTNVLDGSAAAYTGRTVVVLPGIHQLRRYSTRDQVFRPADSESASGGAPFQSNEGLSIGVDLAVRWAIDRDRVAQMATEFPEDLNA